ncbi:hypothetical protein KEM52_006290, partial [Ascosphaera acerosa]
MTTATMDDPQDDDRPDRPTAPEPRDHPDSPQRHVEIVKLWNDLNGQGKPALNFRDFKRGLKHTDHCLKDADHLIREIFRAVDKDRDGRIQFA